MPPVTWEPSSSLMATGGSSFVGACGVLPLTAVWTMAVRPLMVAALMVTRRVTLLVARL
jgi:hypothetical protein